MNPQQHGHEVEGQLSKRWSYLTYRLSQLPRQSRSYTSYIVNKFRHGHNLPALAMAMGTDKEGTHFYTSHHVFHFATLRYRRLKILEIGVLSGAFLGTWRAFSLTVKFM